MSSNRETDQKDIMLHNAAKKEYTMIISIIEQVYSLLWGDLIMIPLPGGRRSWNLFVGTSFDSDRNLFHNTNEISAAETFSGYDKVSFGEKRT